MKTNIFTLEQENNTPAIFISSAWQQHAELVGRLCQLSQNILLIVGPQGAGKTTFLSHVSKKFSSSMRQLTLSADPLETGEFLLQRVISGFDILWENNESPYQMLQQALEEAELLAQSLVLFVDDAHLLTQEQLQALLGMIKFDAPPSSQLHLVLLGEPSLELRLFSPESISVVQGRISTIELEPWTLSDLKSYFARESALLSDDQIAFIFERSRGLPGYVIREKETVHDQLTMTGSKIMANQDLRKWHVPHPITLGVVIGVLLGGSYLFFNNTPSEPESTSLTNMAQPKDINLDIENNSANNLANNADVTFQYDNQDNKDNPSPSPIANADPAVNPVANPDAIGTPSQITDENPPTEITSSGSESAPTIIIPEEPIAIAPQAVAPEPETIIMPKQEDAVKSERIAKLTKTAKTAKAAKIAKPNLKQATTTADARHYTLQLVGSKKEANVKQFILRHALQDKAHYVRTTREGDDWYVVMYGKYPTSQQAKSALTTVPKSLQNENVKPWVREVKGGLLAKSTSTSIDKTNKNTNEDILPVKSGKVCTLSPCA